MNPIRRPLLRIIRSPLTRLEAISRQSAVSRHVVNCPSNRHSSQATKPESPSSSKHSNASPGFLFGAAGLFVLSYAGGYWIGNSSRPEEDLASTLPLPKVRGVPVNGDWEHVKAIWDDLVAIVGQDNITNLEGDLEYHSTSDWSTHKWDPQHKPCAVVYPGSTDDVSRIMKICHKKEIPVTAFSGGTSLEGHYTPTRGGISLDFARMNNVLALHEDDLDVVVQPAVGWQALNETVGKNKLFFPPDPGPGAMIGGMINTGCSGTNAYRYGTMKDWVLNLTVVLADGTIIKTRRRPRKSSAGYNLTQLFIGSEGTLGLVTEATLKLTPLPQSTSVAVCSFGTVRQAASCAAEIVRQGIPLGAIEILDDAQMKHINEFRGSKGKDSNEAPTLFLKFGGTPDGVKEQLRIVEHLARTNGSINFALSKNKAEEAELWSARRDAFWATSSLKSEGQDILTSDVAVPISRLPEAIEGAQKHLKRLGMIGSIVGHVGDALLIYDRENQDKAKEYLEGLVSRAIAADGTCTGEHGVGIGKRESVVEELGEDTVAAMRRIKQAYDPLCLLNCDKIFVALEKTRS